MSSAMPNAKTPSSPTAARPSAVKAGIFATLAHPLRGRGRGTPSAGRRARRGAPALLAAISALALLLSATPALADEFGLESYDSTFTEADGSPATQAGSHPFAYTTELNFNTREAPGGGLLPAAPLKDVEVFQIEGLAGTPTPLPPCTGLEFLQSPSHNRAECPDSSVLGLVDVQIGEEKGIAHQYAPVYELYAPPGRAAALGFWIGPVPVTVEVGLGESPPHLLVAHTTNTSQILEVFAAELTVWGNPAAAAHDPLRGNCLNVNTGISTGSECEAGVTERPFLTLPRACRGPLQTTFAIDSWTDPGARLENGEPDLADPAWITASSPTHDQLGNPEGFSGCGKLNFAPSISAQPTSLAATSPTGLEFSLDVADEGIENPGGYANSDIERAVVTLPAGMTVNPSQAEGLEVCTEAQLARESASSQFGAGCPAAAKIGSIEVETPLLPEKLLKGSLFVAEPYQNPFGSLVAFYIVIKSAALGVKIVQPAKVTPDPATGQLVTTTEDMPQLPFSHFRLHFKEGARSPLVTPPACGTYDGAENPDGSTNPDPVRALLYPYAGGPPVESTSSFEIVSGPNNTPCPAGGTPPFHPSLLAGTQNNAAGAFSPFLLKLSRTDSEQEITNLSIKLPPGVLAKLAGVGQCTDAQIAIARSRTGPHGGAEELAAPSCPASSAVGRSLAGSGVGPALAYAPGQIYLAGPYNGKPLSLVAITAGVVGPFDVGTVVVRFAIDVNPETGEVFLDSVASDPIPHILKGIVLHLREIRSYVDRPDFTLNPTSCDPTQTATTVLGSGADFVSAADDNPFVSTSRFQAADCAALPFHPKLTFKAKGAPHRRGNPSLRAHVAMSGFGEAAITFAQVTLPKSEFLDNSHIGTVCTRVQFNAGSVPGEACPPQSVYGSVSATTPILSEPLTGPIFLRSSEHKLPDLVAALHSNLIDVNLVGRVDSVKGGGIRNTFEFVPDAPVTSADFTFGGGKKSLLKNSQDLCKGKHQVKVFLKAHSGRQLTYKTPLKPTGCKKKKKRKSKRTHHRRARGSLSSASRVR